MAILDKFWNSIHGIHEGDMRYRKWLCNPRQYFYNGASQMRKATLIQICVESLSAILGAYPFCFTFNIQHITVKPILVSPERLSTPPFGLWLCPVLESGQAGKLSFIYEKVDMGLEIKRFIWDYVNTYHSSDDQSQEEGEAGDVNISLQFWYFEKIFIE